MSKSTTQVTKTLNIKDVINVTREIGDTLSTTFNKTGDIKVATASLDAYKTAISGSKVQLIYKKLTGHPSVIAFLED